LVLDKRLEYGLAEHHFYWYFRGFNITNIEWAFLATTKAIQGEFHFVQDWFF